MNDDLKAYVDGELPPDAAERVRAALDADPFLRKEAEALRSLGVALRALPEPEPVGQAATLAALSQRRPLWSSPLIRLWGPALAGCAAVLLVASSLARHSVGPPIVPVVRLIPGNAAAEATIPAVRREAFIRYVRSLGGEVHRDGDGLRAFYPQTAHDDVKRRFLLPGDLAWPTDGLRIRLTP